MQNLYMYACIPVNHTIYCVWLVNGLETPQLFAGRHPGYGLSMSDIGYLCLPFTSTFRQGLLINYVLDEYLTNNTSHPSMM